MKSYTHAVFLKGKEEIVKYTLHEVSFALLQIRELSSSEDHVVGLLWVLEFIRKPRKGYFNNSKRETLRESLVEYQVLTKKGDDWEVDEVFLRVLKEVDRQNDLYNRAFKLVQNFKKNPSPALSESEPEVSLISNRYEIFADSISLDLDFWDQASGKYSNPDKIPDSLLKVKVGRHTYEFLRSLKW